MTAVKTSKRRLATVNPINKYKALEETDSGQSCIATAKKYGVAKNTVTYWLEKNAEIFEAVRANNVSKRRKE